MMPARRRQRCDRFAGKALGASIAAVRELEDFIIGEHTPDHYRYSLTVIFEDGVSVGQAEFAETKT